MRSVDRDNCLLLGGIVLVYVVALLATPTARQIDHPLAHLTLTCRISPTDQEAQEGYFPCGTSRSQSISINVDPSSDMATFLRAKVGTTIRLTIAPAAEEAR